MENSKLSDFVADFVAEYFDNGGSTEDLQQWLSDAMVKHMPEMSADEADVSSGKIVKAVDRLNGRIISSQKAAEKGISAEDWFKQEFDSETEGMSLAEKGKILTGMYNGFCNAESGFTGEPAEFETELSENEWNRFTLAQMTSKVLEKSGMTALQAAANEAAEAITHSLEEHTEIDCGEVLTAAIGTGADVGVKCAAAGAAKIAMSKGWLPLPEDTSEDELANLAVGAVEDAKVCILAATGKITAAEAVDRVQRNIIARALDFIAEHAPAICEKIGGIFGPVGAKVGRIIGEGIQYLASTEVRELVKAGLNKIGEAAKNVILKVGGFLKEKVKSVISFFA